MKHLKSHTCVVKKCFMTVVAKGLCCAHYQRLRNSGSLMPKKDKLNGRNLLFGKGKSSSLRCKTPECNKKFYAKQLCRDCYQKQMWIKIAPNEESKCIVPDCKLKRLVKGYCKFHYDAMRIQSLLYKANANITEHIENKNEQD